MTTDVTDITDVYAAHNALEVALAGLPVRVETQVLRARLDLFEESLILTRYERGQAVSVYEIAPDALAAAFTGTPVTTGLLPRECLFAGRDNGKPYFGVYLPPQARVLRVAVATPFTVTLPLPGLVFVGCGVKYRVFAVKHRPTTADEGLFHAPLPNVYDTGTICQGSAAFPVCAAETFYPAIETFFASDFNADLSARKSRQYPQDVLALWRALDGAETFPEDDLLRTGHTIGDLLEGER